MRFRTAALALAIVVGVVGIVAADDTERSWWSLPSVKMPWTKTEEKKDAKKDEMPSGPSASERRSVAHAELKRRRDVCLRLQEIALETGDEELDRRAQELDQRAYDLYVAALARIQPGYVRIEPDVNKKEKRK